MAAAGPYLGFPALEVGTMRSLRMKSMRGGRGGLMALALLMVVSCALGVVAGAASGAQAKNPDLKPPTLLMPAPNVASEAGAPVTFRIRTHARDVGLMLRVSRSSVRGKCGVIRGEVARASFVRTGTPAVYQAQPAGTALSSSWLNAPGTYFWQAYRIGGRDGCVESGVRSLQLAPKEPLALTEARLDGTSKVTRRITAVDGFSMKVGDSSTITHTFKPTCASGPCDTTVSFGVSGMFPGLSTTVTLPLTRTGASYAGSGPAALSKCNFSTVTGTLEVRLEISGGAWLGNTWRVTGVVGHERYSTPEKVLGIWTCRAASWEADLSGTLGGTGELSVNGS